MRSPDRVHFRVSPRHNYYFGLTYQHISIVARIKKIIQLDEDIVQCSNNATFVIAMATVCRALYLNTSRTPTNARSRRCSSNILPSKGTTWSNRSENHARPSSIKISVGYAYASVSKRSDSMLTYNSFGGITHRQSRVPFRRDSQDYDLQTIQGEEGEGCGESRRHREGPAYSQRYNCTSDTSKWHSDGRCHPTKRRFKDIISVGFSAYGPCECVDCGPDSRAHGNP